MGKKINSKQCRLTNRHHPRVRVAAACAAAAALLDLHGTRRATAATVPTDNTYSLTGSAAGPVNLSTAALTGTYNSSPATPTFTSDINGEIDFGDAGAAYTVTDDLATANVNDLTFANTTGLLTLAPAAATNTLTLTTNSLGVTPTISVGLGGATISTILAGTTGFTKLGTGTLTLATNADTLTGNVYINAGTIAANIGQAAAEVFYLNNGATLSTNQGATVANSVVAASGTSNLTYTANVAEAVLLSGNGNVNLTLGNANSTGIGSTLFNNFGGTATLMGNTGGRLGGGNAPGISPFATLDLGTGTSQVYARATSAIVFGGLQSTGTGTILAAANTAGNTDTYVAGSANTNTLFAGTFAQGLGNATGLSALTKVGTGTMTLTGASTNANVGPLNVNGGTLAFNYSSNTAIYSATATVGFGGGTLYLLGNSSGTTAQTLGNTTLNAGGGRLVVDPNGGTSTAANLGTITATAAGGALNIEPTNVTVGTGTATVTTTTAPLTDGTYGARITYGSGYATSTTGSSPYTLSTYTPAATFAGTGDTSTTNYQLTGSKTVTAADSVNSLTVSSATGSAAGLTLGAKLTLTNGGLLYNGSDAYTISNTSGGSLASTATDLVIQQLGTGTLTISAPITNVSTGVSNTLTKAGPGTLILSGVNTYTGATFLDGGVTSITSDANLGAVATGAALNLNGATLLATGGTSFGLFNGTAGTNNRAVTIGGGGGTFNVDPSTTLTVAGVIGGLIANQFGPLVKTGAGTLVLTGANTYGGSTTISGGVISTNTLASAGTNSGIGTAGTGSTADNALVLDGGTLLYTGATTSTNRGFSLTPNGGTLSASGTGPVTFSNTQPVAVTASGPTSGSVTLTLSGTNAAANTLALQVVDPTTSNPAFTGTTAVTKTGAGQWYLTSPNNSYSGPTTVTAGTLRVNNLSGTGAVNVNGGSLGVAGAAATIAGPVTVAGGASLGLSGDSAINALTLTNAAGLTLGGASTASGLTFDLQTTGAISTADSINLGSNLLTVNGGGANLSFSNLGGLGANQTYTLFNYNIADATYNGTPFTTGSGSSVDGLNVNFPLGTSGTLNVTATQVQLVTGAVSTTPPATAYYTGTFGTSLAASSSDGTSGNFSTDAAGTMPVGTYPGPTTDVFIAAANAPAANLPNLTLGQNFDIHSLTFVGTGPAATTATTLGGTNTLAVEGGGITLASGNAGANLGMTTLAVGTSQTWTNNSANPFNVSAGVTSTQASGTTTLTLSNTAAGPTTVSGAIANGTGNTVAVVVNSTGAGTTTFSNSNTYTGGTTVTSGTLIDASTNGTGLGPNVAATTVSIASAGAVVLDAPATTPFTYNQTFSGSGLLKFQFPNIGSSNVFASATAFNNYTGTIELTNSTPAGGDKFNFTGQAGVSGATLQIDTGATAYVTASTAFNAISLAGGGNTEGRGAIRLAGTTTLGGNVSLLSSATIGMDNLTVATLPGNIGSGATGTQTLTVGAATTTGSATFSGVLGGGTGTLALTTNDGTTNLTNAANSYKGTTTVNAGSSLFLTAASPNNIPNSGKIVVNGTGILNAAGLTGGGITLASGQVLAGTGGTVTGTTTVPTGSTITAGSGATATADTLGVLNTGTQTWTGGTYAVKLNGAQATPEPVGSGLSTSNPVTAGAVPNDELVLSGLSSLSTGLTISPVLVNGASFATANYSYVIANDTVSSTPASTTAFDGLALSSISRPAGYSLSTASTGGSDQELILDFASTASAPEPTSLLLAGLAAAPLVLGRRRRRVAAAV